MLSLLLLLLLLLLLKTVDTSRHSNMFCFRCTSSLSDHLDSMNDKLNALEIDRIADHLRYSYSICKIHLRNCISSTFGRHHNVPQPSESLRAPCSIVCLGFQLLAVGETYFAVKTILVSILLRD